ncbi:MAG: hypothetical protein HY507_00845 [Candidatus Zambryskibacteria bacterium]|nr:hypothetical protein [Candidatus Zambryskibacteria bacterium]
MNDAISDAALDLEFCRLNQEHERKTGAIVPFHQPERAQRRRRYFGKSLTDNALRKMSLFISSHVKDED